MNTSEQYIKNIQLMKDSMEGAFSSEKDRRAWMKMVGLRYYSQKDIDRMREEPRQCEEGKEKKI